MKEKNILSSFVLLRLESLFLFVAFFYFFKRTVNVKLDYNDQVYDEILVIANNL